MYAVIGVSMSSEVENSTQDQTCPSCGEVLIEGADGELTCPTGDYEPKIDWGLEDEDENDAPVEED